LDNISKVVATVLAFFLVSHQGYAQAEKSPCIGGDADDPEIYALQDSFLKGRYSTFYDKVDPFGSVENDARSAQIETLMQKTPDGFVQCSLLLSEQRGQRLLQTVTAYETQDGQYLFMLVVFAKLDRENKVIMYHFSSAPEEVFNRLM